MNLPHKMEAKKVDSKINKYEFWGMYGGGRIA